MDRRGTIALRASAWMARLIVGGAFVYAGWLKAVEPAVLVRDVWSYRLVPESAAYWVAAYLPYLEIVAGLALITGLQRRGAHLVLAALLAVFLVGLISAQARGLDISCGCFGAASATGPTNYPLLYARDIGMLALLGWSWIQAKRPAR